MNTLAQKYGFSSSQFDAMINKAFDLVDAGELDSAGMMLDGLIVLDPTNARFHAALGAVLHQQGKLDEASAAYERALAIDGGSPLALVNRGELRCQRGDLGGLDDLRVAAQLKSPVRTKAEALLRRFSAVS
jgi:Flp pilus assembly protein TadD